MLKAVIFDMDGLMVDTEKLLQRFWVEAANFYGYPMTPEQVLDIRSLSSKYSKPHLKGIFGEDFDYYAVRSKRIELMNAYIDRHGIEKKYGLDTLLDYLKTTDIKTSVCTATDATRTKRYLESVGVYHKFNRVICGNMLENGKPAPDIYLMAAKELGFAPEECVALEDSPNGILSAYTAGCIPVMVPDLTQPDEKTAKMLYSKCDTLEDVILIVEKLI